MVLSKVHQQFVLSADDDASTFSEDENLPNLPVPRLEDTIRRYLNSVKPFAENEQEFLYTEQTALDFLQQEGAELNAKLLQRADNYRNWLEKWWEDYAYLTLREPLIPHYNMTGPHPLIPGFQYGPGQQLKVASAYCHQMVQAWLLLRKERLRPAAAADKRPLSMHQFRRLFNCAVEPGLAKDTIKTYFKTEREGKCSSHVVVLCNGHMFIVDALRTDGQPLTPAEWLHQLTIVKSRAAQRGPRVPQLCCDYRTPWAQNRQHLMHLNPVNAAIFATVDAAMFVLCLDQASPVSEANISHQVLCGDYACRWPDAASNLVFFENGFSGGLSLHSAYDGIVSGTVTLLASEGVKTTIDRWIAAPGNGNLTEPQQLNFVLDNKIRAEISRLEAEQKVEKNKYSLVQERFQQFGKQKIQEVKVHPDSFIQMALQLAYFSLHSRFAPCYETATTRAFYHGRTETVRSCSNECVNWVKSMVDSQVKDSERAQLLQKAIVQHNELMAEGRNNEGCDRHLLGLYCTAIENNQPVPKLFLDPLFERSGGGGNFVLSTSLLGYSPLGGCVVPMCLDGYGIFYSIMPDSLLFTISVRNDSFETSCNKMYKAICESLENMIDLLHGHTVSKL